MNALGSIPYASDGRERGFLLRREPIATEEFGILSGMDSDGLPDASFGRMHVSNPSLGHGVRDWRRSIASVRSVCSSQPLLLNWHRASHAHDKFLCKAPWAVRSSGNANTDAAWTAASDRLQPCRKVYWAIVSRIIWHRSSLELSQHSASAPFISEK